MGVVLDFNGEIIDIFDFGFDEGETDDLGMRSLIGPGLIEDKIAKRIKNWFTVKAPLLLGGVSRSDGVVIIINLISRNHLPLRVLLLKGGEFFY